VIRNTILSQDCTRLIQERHAEFMSQPSLRDGSALNWTPPALKRPGYRQMSLRDMNLLRPELDVPDVKPLRVPAPGLV
jgi:hypothetical protein